MGFEQIGVIGAGAWGTALALTCARAGRKVVLWEHDAVNAAHLAKARESLFLPGVRLDDAIALTGNLAEAARADALLLVVPAQTVRGSQRRWRRSSGRARRSSSAPRASSAAPASS